MEQVRVSATFAAFGCHRKAHTQPVIHVFLGHVDSGIYVCVCILCVTCCCYSTGDLSTARVLLNEDNVGDTTDTGLSLLHISCISGGTFAPTVGAGIAQCLVARLVIERSQEWRENFLLQGQFSVLTLILVSVPSLCYCSSQ